MLLLVDAEGRYRHWSPAAAEALGWTEEEVVGTKAIDLVHPDDREEVARAFAAVSTRSGTPVRHRARMRRKDGTWRLVEGVGRDLLSDEDIRSVVLNVRDVTEQQRTEEQLLQSQKLESIGRLAGGIAHDFNNLLTVILCSAESEGEALDAGRSVEREDVDQIREAGARARDLTRDLLAFARRQGAAPTTLDLNALLGGSDKLLRRVIREDIHLETALQPGIWPVRCDPAQLEQVILNLAVNARDAMNSGGRLRLATANVRIEPEHPDIPPGDWVRLRIQDDGAGMSREVKEHLFEPFFTTKPAGQGTGLGLSTVYGIVRQAGGHVRVESEPGTGSTFDVYLPRSGGTAAGGARGRPASRRLRDRDRAARRGRPRRPGGHAARAPGRRLPGARGSRRGGGPGGREDRRDAPALLVTDVIMPAVSGPDLAARLRAELPAMRVLYLSGYAHGVIGPHGVLDPGVAFLPKPFTPRSLLARVREVLDAP